MYLINVVMLYPFGFKADTLLPIGWGPMLTCSYCHPKLDPVTVLVTFQFGTGIV